MKKITLVAAGVLVAACAFAGVYEPPKGSTGMAVVRSDESSFKLYYKAEEKTNVKVQIFNDEQKLVFSEVITQSNGFSRPYNFGNLREGDYTIRVDNGSNWLSETITYKIGSEEEPVQVVKIDKGRYMVTLAGGEDEVIAVRILNDKGDVLYEGSQKVDGAFAQVYNLGKFSGPFAFEVSGKNGTRFFNK